MGGQVRAQRYMLNVGVCVFTFAYVCGCVCIVYGISSFVCVCVFVDVCVCVCVRMILRAVVWVRDWVNGWVGECGRPRVHLERVRMRVYVCKDRHVFLNPGNPGSPGNPRKFQLGLL